MRTKTGKLGTWVLLAVAALPLFQAGGCAVNTAVQAVTFEISNLISGVIFNQTQILFENLLNL